MASLLKEAMSEVMMKEGPNFYGRSTMVSIIEVAVTPDVSIARFYLSVFNSDKGEEIIEILNKNQSEFRRGLGNKLKHNLRKIPEIEFYIDESIQYAQKMNKIFNDVKKEEKQ